MQRFILIVKVFLSKDDCTVSQKIDKCDHGFPCQLFRINLEFQIRASTRACGSEACSCGNRTPSDEKLLPSLSIYKLAHDFIFGSISGSGIVNTVNQGDIVLRGSYMILRISVKQHRLEPWRSIVIDRADIDHLPILVDHNIK